MWELDKKIFDKTDFRYILEIVDHFSKLLWYFPLIDKEAKNSTYKCGKISFSICLSSNISNDNGAEFVNRDLKLFCENNNINFINRSSKHPCTNGAIEVTHKKLQKFIKIDLKI